MVINLRSPRSRSSALATRRAITTCRIARICAWSATLLRRSFRRISRRDKGLKSAHFLLRGNWSSPDGTYRTPSLGIAISPLQRMKRPGEEDDGMCLRPRTPRRHEDAADTD